MELLHVYAELAAADTPPRAERGTRRWRHTLRSCGPCTEDLQGLLAAIPGGSHGILTGPENIAAGGKPPATRQSLNPCPH